MESPRSATPVARSLTDFFVAQGHELVSAFSIGPSASDEQSPNHHACVTGMNPA